MLALAIVATLGPSISNAMLAITVVGVPSFARLIRASVLSLKEQAFVEAARCSGRPGPLDHPPHPAEQRLDGDRLRDARDRQDGGLRAGLSFLGLGVQPPTPEWGRCWPTAARCWPSRRTSRPSPGVTIFLVTLGFNISATPSATPSIRACATERRRAAAGRRRRRPRGLAGQRPPRLSSQVMSPTAVVCQPSVAYSRRSVANNSCTVSRPGSTASRSIRSSPRSVSARPSEPRRTTTRVSESTTNAIDVPFAMQRRTFLPDRARAGSARRSPRRCPPSRAVAHHFAALVVAESVPAVHRHVGHQRIAPIGGAQPVAATASRRGLANRLIGSARLGWRRPCSHCGATFCTTTPSISSSAGLGQLEELLQRHPLRDRHLGPPRHSHPECTG